MNTTAVYNSTSGAVEVVGDAGAPRLITLAVKTVTEIARLLSSAGVSDEGTAIEILTTMIKEEHERRLNNDDNNL